MSRTTPWVIAAVLLVAGVIVMTTSLESVRAEPPESRATGEPSGERDGMRRKVVKRLRQARRTFLQGRLSLDDATAEKLDDALRKHDKARRQARKQSREARRALAAALQDDSTSETDLIRLTRELEDAVRATDAQKLAIFSEVDALLDARQQALLHLALPAFERKVERAVRNARGKARKGRGGKHKPRGRDGRPRRHRQP